MEVQMRKFSVRYAAIFVVWAFLTAAVAPNSAFGNITTGNEETPVSRFSGTWQGKCQDGRTFVIVDLRQRGAQLGGTVSIGNMHGDDQGACMMVLAPPVPEHAQTISNAAVKQNTLSFDGAKRPDGSATRFELTLTQIGAAELKLLGSPVENHPWQLAKASTAK
jgi:hypothetical protein